jgi:hypothetical protein
LLSSVEVLPEQHGQLATLLHLPGALQLMSVRRGQHRRRCRSSFLSGTAGSEAAYRLPKESAAAFPALLRELGPGGAGATLGVAGYGLSEATLEQVFLRVSEAAGAAANAAAAGEEGRGTNGTLGRKKGDAAAAAPPPRDEFLLVHVPRSSYLKVRLAAVPVEGNHLPFLPLAGGLAWDPVGCSQKPGVHVCCRAFRVASQAASPPPTHTRPQGFRLWCQQLRALLAKRALCAVRDWWAAGVQVAVPALLVLLALWSNQLSAALPQQPPLPLDR